MSKVTVSIHLGLVRNGEIKLATLHLGCKLTKLEIQEASKTGNYLHIRMQAFEQSAQGRNTYVSESRTEKRT